MRSTGQLLDAAVANNASWCAAVCGAHGHPSVRGRRLWASSGHGVPFYPDAITLSPEVSAAEVLAVAPPSGAFAVKDSYGTLDLAPAGFLLPIQASWIARPAAAGPASGPAGRTSGGPDWHQVSRPPATESRAGSPRLRPGQPGVPAAAVRFLAGEAGIRQIIDTGIPAAGNVHARHHRQIAPQPPDSRISMPGADNSAPAGARTGAT